MRVGRRKLIAGATGLLVSISAIAAWYVGGTDLLLAVVLATVLIGLGAVGLMVAQSERRLREIAKRPASKVAALSKNVDGLNRSVIALANRVQRPSEHAEALLRAVKAAHRRIELEQSQHAEALLQAVKDGHSKLESEQGRHTEALKRHENLLKRELKHTPAEVDALLQVHRLMGLEDPLPLMGGWALSPRGMLQAIELSLQPDVSLVVECGSGTSTLFVARALELRAGSGKKLVALEHLVEFAERTRRTLKEHNLEHVAEVRHAPLEEVSIDGHPYMWYSTSALSDLGDIDLLLVDGPPGSTGSLARYPAYPLLRERLSSSAVILLDDVRRSDERETVERWVRIGDLTESHALSSDQAILHLVGDADREPEGD